MESVADVGRWRRAKLANTRNHEKAREGGERRTNGMNINSGKVMRMDTAKDLEEHLERRDREC